jgi:hypothetical protein
MGTGDEDEGRKATIIFVWDAGLGGGEDNGGGNQGHPYYKEEKRKTLKRSWFHQSAPS